MGTRSQSNVFQQKIFSLSLAGSLGLLAHIIIRSSLMGDIFITVAGSKWLFNAWPMPTIKRGWNTCNQRQDGKKKGRRQGAYKLKRSKVLLSYHKAWLLLIPSWLPKTVTEGPKSCISYPQMFLSIWWNDASYSLGWLKGYFFPYLIRLNHLIRCLVPLAPPLLLTSN